MNDLKLTGMSFYQCGQALDPIPIVAVKNAIHITDLWLVNMATHHPRIASSAGFIRENLFILRDE
jgi:hypothetical protein